MKWSGKRKRIRAMCIIAGVECLILLGEVGIYAWSYQKEIATGITEDMQVRESGSISEWVQEEERSPKENGMNRGDTLSLEDTEIIGNSDEETEGDGVLTLVNPWNAIPEDYTVSLVELVNGQAVDERCYQDLQEMMDDCRAEGMQPYICSSYRTWQKQTQLFEENVAKLMAEGYSEDEARLLTAKVVAVPGTSEHQLGLAVDIVDKNNPVLEEEQEDTAVQQWLMKNSWRYGFILRYPEDKSEKTGIIYEPWHYRYVGKEAASEIYQQGICLEEWLIIKNP